MKTWTKACWASLIAASLVAVAQADDAAIVHITDRPTPVPDPGPGAPATATAPVVSGASAPCNGAACGGDAAGGCWLNPTRGFQPYQAAPIYREAIVYYRYWPDKWYGEPGYNLRPMFPQVYQPTDTTQLGFYYARVPQWMPNPNMYPPAPRPEDWHRHVMYAGGAGACGGASVGAGMEMGAPVQGPAQPTPAQPGSNPPTNLGVPASPPPANAPAPQPMPPSAMIQGGSVQPAAASGEHHWSFDDVVHAFSRDHATQAAPAYEAPAQPADVPPAPAPQQ